MRAGLDDPIGIGISSPGPLDPWHGVVIAPPAFIVKLSAPAPFVFVLTVMPPGGKIGTSVEVTFTGTDTLRIADGMLAEYWANADSLLFFQQLGVREVPALGGYGS